VASCIGYAIGKPKLGVPHVVKEAVGSVYTVGEPLNLRRHAPF
jgi:hypothetical protein